MLSRGGFEISEIWERQQRALEEAVRGGLGADQRRMATVVSYDNEHDGDRTYHRLPNAAALKNHPAIYNTKRRPSITFGVVHKKDDPGDVQPHEGGLQHGDPRFVSRITFGHQPSDEGNPETGDGLSHRMEPRGDSAEAEEGASHAGRRLGHIGAETQEAHQRKGWAGTVWKHAKRMLRKHSKIDPSMDWRSQTAEGAKWSRQVEPGDSPESSGRRKVDDPHGDTHKALRQHDSIAGDRKKPLHWDDVHPDDQEAILDHAEQHLDHNNGFWHHKRSHASVKKVMRHLGYPSPSSEFAADLFHNMGGRRK